MIAFLEQMVFWHWWILAVLLAIIEVFAPGAIFIWLGASAGVVGFVMLALPETSWKIQLLIWSVLSVASVVGWRLYLKRNPTETDRPTLNRRGEQYVGRQFTLAEPVVNGWGKIQVDDSTWKIECDNDLPAGAKVEVTDVEGTVLRVKTA